MTKKLFFVFILFSFFLEIIANSVLVEGGKVDLRIFDLDNQVASIQGEVLFSWENFVSPDSIDDSRFKWEFINTEHSWNKQEEPVRSYSIFGYGTYRFTVLIPDSLVGETFILRPDHVITYASQVFVNGEECAHNGRVGISEEDDNYQPSRKMEAYSFVPERNELTVVIWVANFHHYRGGVFKPISLGLEKNMIHLREKAVTRDLFTIMSLLIMLLYHIILYAMNYGERSSLYFAIACLFFAGDLSFQGPMTFFLFFPNVSFEFYSVLQLITPYFIPSSFVLFFYSIFPEFVSRKLTKFAVFLSVLFASLTIFGSVTTRALVIEPNYIFAVLLVFYLYFVVYKVLKKRVPGALFFSVAYLVFSLCALNDIMNMFELIHTTNLLSYGILVFVFLLSILQGERTNNLHLNTVKLSRELTDLNLDLETKVKERTAELDGSLRNLNRLNKFQEGMTNMIAHDLKGPLMQIIGVEKVSVSNVGAIKNSGYRMLNMVQNMLDTYKFSNKRVEVKQERINIVEAIDELVGEFSFFARKKTINIELLQQASLDLNSDSHMFKRIVSNILSNAIRFSPVGGLIQIKISPLETDNVRIGISNQGPKLSSELKECVFDIHSSMHTKVSDEYKTSGLGLSLCKMAIDALGGRIGVISEDDLDLEFWFALPGAVLVDKEKSTRVINVSDEVVLTEEEKVYLRPYVEELLECRIFEASKIDNILKKISRDQVEVDNWCAYIEKACYLLDGQLYTKVLTFVK